MPAKPKKPSPAQKQPRKRKTKAELTKPFDKKVLAKAKKIAAQYTIIIHFEDEEYYGRTLEMPFVMADGPTPERCMTEVLEATIAAVAYILEEGEVPPQAASAEKRSAQVNIRLTAQEKFRLEHAARQAGFRGLSDFVRYAALDKAG
ncbi:MAG: hypothetical protein AAGC44_02195 [Planctomycetota bacterium]